MDGNPSSIYFTVHPELKPSKVGMKFEENDGSHPADKIDPLEANEAVNQLVALGYIEKPDENRERAAEESVRELRYNHACSLMDAGLHLRALPIFKELLERWPEEYRFGIHLVTCYQELGKITDAHLLLEELFQRKKQKSQEAVIKLKEFVKEHKDIPFETLSSEDQRNSAPLGQEPPGVPMPRNI